MRIAHGLFEWQSGRVALEACLRSTVPYVDELIIAEGLIEGVPDLGLPWHTDLRWLAEPAGPGLAGEWLPDHIWISAHAPPQSIGDDGRGNPRFLPPSSDRPWPSLSACCNWILGRARALEIDWLLYVDADQELHNGEALADWLEDWPGDAVPISRQEPDRRIVAPWQLIRVSAFKRYLSGCSVLEHVDGRQVTLVPPNDREPFPFARAPWISHHPERRPAWRRAQRLGAFETVLEPPAPGAVALA